MQQTPQTTVMGVNRKGRGDKDKCTPASVALEFETDDIVSYHPKMSLPDVDFLQMQWCKLQNKRYTSNSIASSSNCSFLETMGCACSSTFKQLKRYRHHTYMTPTRTRKDVTKYYSI